MVDIRRTRLALVVCVVGAFVAASGAAHAAPARTPSAIAAPTCVSTQVDRRAPGVRSSLPVLLLGSGLNQPDDIQVTGEEVLVGELGNGAIARFGVATAIGGFDLLPANVPTIEGMVRIGAIQFAANQGADRIVTINGAQVTTFLQLRPVRGREGVDGIGAVGNTLVVPDAPRGRVLFVGPSGRIQRVVTGFARPVNAWPLPSGAVLIPDENANRLVRINPDFSLTTVLRGVSVPDEVVTDLEGNMFADSLGRNNVIQVVGGAATEIAGNFGQPQGLAPDQAGNLYVAEEDLGRLDVVVRSVKLQPALSTAPSLPAGQSVCVALDRAPGFAAPVTIDPGTGYTVTAQPGTGSVGAIQPAGCTGVCKLHVTVHSGTRTDGVWLQVRV